MQSYGVRQPGSRESTRDVVGRPATYMAGAGRTGRGHVPRRRLTRKVSLGTRLVDHVQDVVAL